jgi:hypothetical protein
VRRPPLEETGLIRSPSKYTFKFAGADFKTKVDCAYNDSAALVHANIMHKKDVFSIISV